MRLLTAALTSVLLSCPAWGCAWDSNTLEEELQLQERGIELFDLITGQFPHHGDAFYEAQLDRARVTLTTTPEDWGARDDAAVALMKLERFEESERELQAQLVDRPNRYETLSNLGVLNKTRERFGAATEFIAQALKIKPEGHMGLGDWYLRMLRFRAALQAGPHVPETTFLGVGYETPLYEYPEDLLGDPALDPDEALLERTLALIRNDRSFPGAYLLLGKLLRQRSPSLALWAYSRAMQLGHPNRGAVEAAIREAFRTLHRHVEHDTHASLNYVEEPKTALIQINLDLYRAKAWLERFQSVEAERVRAGEPADFASVLDALDAAGVKPLRSPGYAIRVGLRGLLSGPSRMVVWLALLTIGFLGGLKWRRTRRNRRRESNPARLATHPTPNGHNLASRS